MRSGMVCPVMRGCSSGTGSVLPPLPWEDCRLRGLQLPPRYPRRRILSAAHAPFCAAVSLPPSRHPLLCLLPWLILSSPPQCVCFSQEHKPHLSFSTPGPPQGATLQHAEGSACCPDWPSPWNPDLLQCTSRASLRTPLLSNASHPTHTRQSYQHTPRPRPPLSTIFPVV